MQCWCSTCAFAKSGIFLTVVVFSYRRFQNASYTNGTWCIMVLFYLMLGFLWDICCLFLYGCFGSWVVASSPVADWVHVQMPKPFCPSFQFLEQGQPAAETIRKYPPEN